MAAFGPEPRIGMPVPITEVPGPRVYPSPILWTDALRNELDLEEDLEALYTVAGDETDANPLSHPEEDLTSAFDMDWTSTSTDDSVEDQNMYAQSAIDKEGERLTADYEGDEDVRLAPDPDEDLEERLNSAAAWYESTLESPLMTNWNPPRRASIVIERVGNDFRCYSGLLDMHKVTPERQSRAAISMVIADGLIEKAKFVLKSASSSIYANLEENVWKNLASVDEVQDWVKRCLLNIKDEDLETAISGLRRRWLVRLPDGTILPLGQIVAASQETNIRWESVRDIMKEEPKDAPYTDLEIARRILGTKAGDKRKLNAGRASVCRIRTAMGVPQPATKDEKVGRKDLYSQNKTLEELMVSDK